MYTVITENDESMWDDKTGNLYHFPNRYLKFLQPGTSIIYYKGGMKDKKYKEYRLSERPHYFGVAQVGEIIPDSANPKNHFCSVVGFTQFDEAILAKVGDNYLESIPASRESNYWRDGVRPISQEVYQIVLSQTSINQLESPGFDSSVPPQEEFESYQEGNPKIRYSTIYERNPALRQKAIEIHGTTCQACSFNFEARYGELGKGYIHVHHLKPMANIKGKTFVNPALDMCVLCANCHAIVHRKRESTLTLEELKSILKTLD